MEKHTSSKVLHEVYFALCKSIDTPVSLGLWLRYKYGEFSDLVGVTVDPKDYLNAYSFFLDYTAVSYLSKYEDLDTGIDRDGVALQKFNTSEEQCRATNLRFRFGAPHGAFEPVLFKARRKIADILGPVDLDGIADLFKWGPGATFDLTRDVARPDVKQSVVPSVTADCLPLARAVVSRDIHWFEAVTGVLPEGPFSVTNDFFSVVRGNRVITVPKNAKTNRTIAAEPTMNSYVQQGIGRYIRRRLKRFGVDLNNQEINQTWASKALDLDLATLDLSAASDTIAREVVFELLPTDWAGLLDMCRSKCFKQENDRYSFYEKFSSMGNAFTFELESLIFYALITSVCEVHGVSTACCSVFGDDIICPAVVSSEIIDCFEHFGFKTNVEKSFCSGQFYESCGEHFFGGHNVTPIYQKKPLSGPEIVRAGNRLVRCGIRSAMGVGIDGTFEGAYRVLLRSASPKYRRCRIPIGSSADDGFLTTQTELSATFVAGRGYRCTTFKESFRYTEADQEGAFAHSIRSLAFGVERPPFVKCSLSGGVLTNSALIHAVEDEFIRTSERTSGYSHGLGRTDLNGWVRRASRSVRTTKRWVIPTWEHSLEFI